MSVVCCLLHYVNNLKFVVYWLLIILLKKELNEENLKKWFLSLIKTNLKCIGVRWATLSGDRWATLQNNFTYLSKHTRPFLKWTQITYHGVVIWGELRQYHLRWYRGLKFEGRCCLPGPLEAEALELVWLRFVVFPHLLTGMMIYKSIAPASLCLMTHCLWNMYNNNN